MNSNVAAESASVILNAQKDLYGSVNKNVKKSTERFHSRDQHLC